MTHLMKRQIQTNKATFLYITLDHIWLQNQIQWKKLSGKTHSYDCISVWFKNKRVWTSLDRKNQNLTKKIFYKKAAVNPLVWHNHHEMHTGQLYWPKVAWKSLFIVPENAFLRFELGFLSKVWVFYGFYIKFCMWLNDFWALIIETDLPSPVDLDLFKRHQFASNLA